MRFFRRILFLLKFHKSIPFMKDFFLSKEVKNTVKIVFATAIVGYILIPIDIIPDFLVFLGIVDDIAIVSFLLQQMIKIAPPSLQKKHGLTPK